MQTVIDWIDPNITPPLFDRRILVLLGGTGSKDCLRTWQRYAHLTDVVMCRTSPNDQWDESEYDEFISSNCQPHGFKDYQFNLIHWHDSEYGLDDEYLDWYSDSIVMWAEMPDFSCVLNKP